MEGNANAGERLQEEAANLLINIREGCKSSQKSIDTLVSGINNLTKHYTDVLKEKLHRELSAFEGYIKLDQIFSVLNNFEDQSIFEGLQTCSEVESFLRDISGGEKVLLKQKVIDYKVMLRKGLPRKVPNNYGYTVPFTDQLSQLLNCPDVLECVDNPLPIQEGIFRTVTDGGFYRFHDVVRKNGPTTLAIYIHVDDAEICDALKSKAGKNNLRLFYWTLGNIHPDKRSSLRAINLLAIARARVCKKYGNEFLLKDFVEEMKTWGTEGVEVNINGKLRRFFAVLIFAACDNPAAANLGKFKETCSALRPCRACMVKKSDMCTNFTEVRGLMRNKFEHEQQVAKVMAQKKPHDNVTVINIYERNVPEEMEVDDEDDSLAVDDYSDHKDPSVNYGINGRSLLSDVPNFDVTKCLPQDIMHVLNEGVVELVCRLLLRDLCLPPSPRVKPKLEISELNLFIQSMCDLGHLKVSRPSEIDKSHISGKKLKQSASQMLVLLRLLPFIIYNRLSEAKLQMLLKLIHFVDSCLSYTMTNDDIKRLARQAEDFGKAFKALYPKLNTLKLHCIAHLATQCRLFGPLRQQWNFHFESMHSLFTSIFPVVRTMKNPPLTAAKRHLASRNAEITKGKKNGNYLTENDGVVGLADGCIGPDAPDMDCLSEVFPDLSELFKVREFHHRGSVWAEGVIMLVNKDGNMFGRIHGVYIKEDNVYFTYNYVKTEYVASYNAHEISKCEQSFELLSFAQLNHKFPMWRISMKFPRTLKSFIIVQSHVSAS